MHQGSVYSRHKRMHYLSYQAVTTPDGLLFHKYGPIEGRKPDAYLICASSSDDLLSVHLMVDSIQYFIYGYQAHVRRA